MRVVTTIFQGAANNGLHAVMFPISSDADMNMHELSQRIQTVCRAVGADEGFPVIDGKIIADSIEFIGAAIKFAALMHILVAEQ
jgi:hypothetical protein